MKCGLRVLVLWGIRCFQSTFGLCDGGALESEERRWR